MTRLSPKTRRPAPGRKRKPGRPGHGMPHDAPDALDPKEFLAPDDVAPGKREKGASSRRTAFSIYMAEMDPVSDVLNPEEEREMAIDIHRGLTAAVKALKKALPEAEKLRALPPGRRTRAQAERIAKARALIAEFNPAHLSGKGLDAHLAHASVNDAGLGMLKWHDRRVYAVAERFIQANLRLVLTLARRFAVHGYMALEDLVQEGNAGLVHALLRFDPHRGFRFSTYGSWWIRHALGRAMADKGRMIRLPVHLIDLSQTVNRARRKLIDELDRMPTDDELAEASGCPMPKLRLLRSALNEPRSLEEPVGEDDGQTLGSIIAFEEPEDPEWKSLIPGQDTAALYQALGELPTIMRDVLLLRFDFIEKPGEALDGKAAEWTLREIGEKYSLSRERIRQLQEVGLARLRTKLIGRPAVT